MKIYQVSLRRSGKESEGFSYHTNKRKAESEQAESNKENETDDEVRCLDVPLTKAGVLHALALFASHPDNG